MQLKFYVLWVLKKKSYSENLPKIFLNGVAWNQKSQIIRCYLSNPLGIFELPSLSGWTTVIWNPNLQEVTSIKKKILKTGKFAQMRHGDDSI
jgi:hypothetical protein